MGTEEKKRKKKEVESSPHSRGRGERKGGKTRYYLLSRMKGRERGGKGRKEREGNLRDCSLKKR